MVVKEKADERRKDGKEEVRNKKQKGLHEK